MNIHRLQRSLDWPDLSYHEKRYTLHHGLLPPRIRQQRMMAIPTLRYEITAEGLVKRVADNVYSRVYQYVQNPAWQSWIQIQWSDLNKKHDT